MSETITGTKIYSGLADLGQFKAYIYIILGTIVSIIMLGVGIMYIHKDDSNDYTSVDGTIKKVVECKSYENNYGDKKIKINKCSLLVAYKYEEKDIEKQIFVESSKFFIEQEPVKLMIKKNDSSNVKLDDALSMKTTGILLIFGGVTCFLLCWLYYYLTHRFEVFSAFSGLGTGLGLLRLF
jgi:hypothetical protein